MVQEGACARRSFAGTLARQYCGALVAPARRTARRSATLVATQLLGTIVAEGVGRVSAAVSSASKRRVGGAIGGVGGYLRGAIGGVGGYLRGASGAVAEKLRFSRPAPASGEAGAAGEPEGGR